MKKFTTEPRREKPRVRPKAKHSSLPLNQIAVIRSCNTDKNTEKREIKTDKADTAEYVSDLCKVALPARDTLPNPKISLPMSISGSRYVVPLKWDPSANSDEPKTQRAENTYIPAAWRKDY